MNKDIEQTKRVNEAKRALTTMIGNFIGISQAGAVKQVLNGQSASSAVDMAERILSVWETIKAMPVTYDNDGKEMKDVTVHLHYFMGGADAWITEKDKGAGGEWSPVTPQQQAYGLVDLGDAEMGYVSLPEILDAGMELDLYWTKTDLEATYKKARDRGYN